MTSATDPFSAGLSAHQAPLGTFFGRRAIVPVLIVDNVREAVPLAQALVAGGLIHLEVTLRTAAALEAIAVMAREVEGGIIGVGTVLTPHDLERAARAGARFAVSPGATDPLLRAADILPLLPGVSSAGESMRCLDAGFTLQKFFPAEPAGGVPYLSALASPLGAVRFCPTGGITPEKAPAYLALANVFAVGGSWMVPRAEIAAGDWTAITQRARKAADLTA